MYLSFLQHTFSIIIMSAIVRCSFTSAALIRPIQLKQQINRKQHDVTKSTFVIQLTIILESLTYFAVIQSVTRSIPLTE